MSGARELVGREAMREKACSGQLKISVSAFPRDLLVFSHTSRFFADERDLDFVTERLACTWGAPCFALQEDPPHSPRVTLSDKVNRIKKMVPNAF